MPGSSESHATPGACPVWPSSSEGLGRIVSSFGRGSLAGVLFGILPLLFAGSLQAAEGVPGAPSKLMVKMSRERDGSRIRFFMENLEPVDVTATFDLSLTNLKSTQNFPCTLSCAPHQKLEVFTLSPIREEEQWTYSVTNYFTIGSQRAVHDERCLYSLPYAKGESHLVSQAFGGGFSHSGPEQYAIDWNMPEGTPVRAARSGVVAGVRQDSRRGGPDRSFEDDANYVLIQHADQTIGNYAHLQASGVTVRIGQKVSAGDLIGYSGNTGFSSGPHLHFSVFKASDGRTRESIPIRFDLGDGQATPLAAGHVYENAPLSAAKAGSSRRARD